MTNVSPNVSTIVNTDRPLPTLQTSAGFSASAPDPLRSARRALQLATVLWVAVAVLGQLIFAAYVLRFYGGSAASGNMSAWSSVMPRGWVAGDHVGNASVVAHVLVAVLICIGGGIQLVPWVRRHAPAVHRWTGRTFMLAAIIGTISGLYLVWVRGGSGGSLRSLGTSANGIAIVWCAVVAWRSARAQRVAEHRQWALRLYLLSNGVWFFRIGLMLSLVIFRRPVGFDAKTFEGPFLTALAWLQFLLPFAVLELWLRATRSPRPIVRYAMAGAMVVLSVATAGGIFGATMGMWLPRM